VKQVLSGLVVVGLISGYALANTTESADATASASPMPSASAQLVAGCTPAAPLRDDTIVYDKAPEGTVSAQTLTLTTNCGDVVIALDVKAPVTAGVMTYLADNKFFDGVNCHRLTTEGIFVLQCGDPKGDGTGGPGFSFPDENLPATGSYPRGTVAMANSGPNTNGSQFFIVYQDTSLPPNYSIWGTITEGLDVIDAVAAAGVSPDDAGSPRTDGPPAQQIVISSAVTAP
jgi:peptidyl-prolyl cis-trans isomerase B (cyclophilin B)